MREHRIDLAGLRREIGARQSVVAVVTADIREQTLELLDIAIDRDPEIRIGTVAAADFLERLGAASDVEPAREGATFATTITIPCVSDGSMIDHPRDVVRDRFKRFRGGGAAPDRWQHARCLFLRRRTARLLVARRAGQQVGEPARAAIASRRGLTGRTRGRPRRTQRLLAVVALWLGEAWSFGTCRLREARRFGARRL